jgi:hypothetical protein
MAITKPARDIFAVLVAYAGVEDTKANREDFGRFYENRELYDPRFIRPSGFPGRIRYCKAGDGWSLEDRPMTKEERDGGGAGRVRGDFLKRVEKALAPFNSRGSR